MDGLLNISFAEYGNVELMLPNIDEQRLLSSFFRNLDNLITLHQRKLLGTFDYKAAKRNLKEAYHFHGAVLLYSDLSLP
jgi:restriction endonuclease S subunit